MTAAQYFSQSLASNNGNVLLTIGMYNGWHQGLTIVSNGFNFHRSCFVHKILTGRSHSGGSLRKLQGAEQP